jgi:hypothetical protein
MIRDDRKKDLSTADVASASHQRDRDRERDAVGGPRPGDERDPTLTPPRTEDEARRAEFDRPHHAAGQHDRVEPGAENTELPPLFENAGRDDMHREWERIQTRFVDEPKRSVEEADHLVAATVQRLAESFARQREQLETQWSRNGDVSTEDLRLAMRRYRAFFERMLSL